MTESSFVEIFFAFLIPDIKGENGKWYMICDNGIDIAVEEVDYLFRADKTESFCIMKKNNEIVSDIKRITFDKRELSTAGAITKVEIACYPNPVTHTLHISGMVNEMTGSIVSIDGRVIKTFTIKNGGVSIPVYDLPEGIYFVKTNNSVLRFVKK